MRKFKSLCTKKLYIKNNNNNKRIILLTKSLVNSHLSSPHTPVHGSRHHNAKAGGRVNGKPRDQILLRDVMGDGSSFVNAYLLSLVVRYCERSSAVTASS